jgi:hypothetical protein
MISLDQVLLLEKKVESAVQRIAQLNTENDALRRKCAELTNALSEKTELLSTFESDQSRIEEGILNALDRLNSVENSVLKATGSVHTAPSADIATVMGNRPVETGTASDVTIQQQEPHIPPETNQKPAADTNGQFDIF